MHWSDFHRNCFKFGSDIFLLDHRKKSKVKSYSRAELLKKNRTKIATFHVSKLALCIHRRSDLTQTHFLGKVNIREHTEYTDFVKCCWKFDRLSDRSIMHWSDFHRNCFKFGSDIFLLDHRKKKQGKILFQSRVIQEKPYKNRYFSRFQAGAVHSQTLRFDSNSFFRQSKYQRTHWIHWFCKMLLENSIDYQTDRLCIDPIFIEIASNLDLIFFY
jgi:hypothetical protein